MQRAYRFDATVVGIRSTSTAFGDWIDLALSGYRDDRVVQPTYSVVVAGEPEAADGRTTKRLHILYKSTITLVRTLSLRTLGKSLLSELGSRELGRRDDAVYLRGALVVADGRVAVLPSSLGRSLDRAARRLQRSGVAVGPTAVLRVDPQTGAVLPAVLDIDVPGDALRRLGELATDDPPEDRLELREPLPVDAVVLMPSGPAHAIRETSRAAAVQALTKDVMNLPTMGSTAVQALARLVTPARCYELRQPDAAALDAIFTTLRVGSAGGPR